MPLTSVTDSNHSAVNLAPSVGLAIVLSSFFLGAWALRHSVFCQTESWKAGLKQCRPNLHWFWERPNVWEWPLYRQMTWGRSTHHTDFPAHTHTRHIYS